LIDSTTIRNIPKLQPSIAGLLYVHHTVLHNNILAISVHHDDDESIGNGQASISHLPDDAGSSISKKGTLHYIEMPVLFSIFYEVEFCIPGKHW